MILVSYPITQALSASAPVFPPIVQVSYSISSVVCTRSHQSRNRVHPSHTYTALAKPILSLSSLSTPPTGPSPLPPSCSLQSPSSHPVPIHPLPSLTSHLTPAHPPFSASETVSSQTGEALRDQRDKKPHSAGSKCVARGRGGDLTRLPSAQSSAWQQHGLRQYRTSRRAWPMSVPDIA
eukprot:2946342-Rhodomonas_salina.3